MVVLASMILAACGGAATPAATQAPAAATQAPATAAPATEAPTAAPTACTAANPSFDPKAADTSGKSITIAYEQEPDNLTGEFSNMSFAVWVDQIIGGGLANWGDKAKFIPEFAAEIPTTHNCGVSSYRFSGTWPL